MAHGVGAGVRVRVRARVGVRVRAIDTLVLFAGESEMGMASARARSCDLSFERPASGVVKLTVGGIASRWHPKAAAGTAWFWRVILSTPLYGGAARPGGVLHVMEFGGFDLRRVGY